MSEGKQVELKREDGLYILNVKEGVSGIGHSVSEAAGHALEMIDKCIADFVRDRIAILEYMKQHPEVSA